MIEKLQMYQLHIILVLFYTWEILPYMAVLNVSMELRTLAVLLTLFCVDRTADLSSFMDTFRLFELNFIRSVHKTVGPRQFYGHV